jgi:ribosomal protein S27E
MKLEYSGDFAYFDCDKCLNRTTVVIKDGELKGYYCAYCGYPLVVEK